MNKMIAIDSLKSYRYFQYQLMCAKCHHTILEWYESASAGIIVLIIFACYAGIMPDAFYMQLSS